MSDEQLLKLRPSQQVCKNVLMGTVWNGETPASAGLWTALTGQGLCSAGMHFNQHTDN